MMTTLANYHHFDGLPWATGYLVNALAYQGALAPHTGKPYTEALLMGINGGLSAGYYAFAYEGYDPHLHFLTRYPFNEEPGAVFERLAIPQESRTTTDPLKGVANVIDGLVAGKPVIVWLDHLTLGAGDLSVPQEYWMINPVLVFGYDREAGTVQIANRARVPFTVSTDTFAAARARIAKTRHRIMTIGTPDADRLPLAVETGIRACIDIFTGNPPVGTPSNWGFAAYDKWIGLLTKPKGKQAWAKMFAPGAKMYAGLTSTYKYIEVFFTGGCGARHIYADFLDEAADILRKPALRDAAQEFRTAANLWRAFTAALLPDSIAPFREARELMVRDYNLFIAQGAAADTERKQIDTRLKALRQHMETDFPLSETEATTMREALAAHVRGIAAVEQLAIAALKEALV
ncbi:MAG: DUF4872 domain-containing protein [Chloroflexota bacterium]|nr:DUF4872 domain-containing protein [Chloroflexota bacterium]